MATLVSPAFILALVSLLTALISLGGLVLQKRRDASDYQSKRIEEAVKLAAASSSMARDLVDPLRSELADVRQEYAIIKELSLSQAKLLEDASLFRDKVQHQLMVITADRNNLLAERIVEEKKIDLAEGERDEMEAERNGMAKERNGMEKERDGATAKRDELQARVEQLECKVLGLEAEIIRLRCERNEFNGAEIRS